MALYDNVTYEYYTDTLGRHIVPDAEAFELYKLENLQQVKALLAEGLLAEREANGIANACCMMIEEDYRAAEIAAGKTGVTASETIGGYSHSMSTKAADLQTEKDARSTAEKKYKWLKLYCYVLGGIK